jgi:hypothetical protein
MFAPLFSLKRAEKFGCRRVFLLQFAGGGRCGFCKYPSPQRELRKLRKLMSDRISAFTAIPALERDFKKTWVNLPPSRRSSRSRRLHRCFAQPTGAHQHVEQGLRLAGVKPSTAAATSSFHFFHGTIYFPLRRECRSAPSVPVCSCAPFCALIAHETAGAASTRHSLLPRSSEGQGSCKASGS